jgi:hypothetical protein
LFQDGAAHNQQRHCDRLTSVTSGCLTWHAFLCKIVVTAKVCAWSPIKIAVTPGKHKYLQEIAVEFEVLTVQAMKRRILWDVTSCGLVEVHRRFGVICYLHLQGISNEPEASSKKSDL